VEGRFRLPISTLLFYGLIAVMALVTIVTFVSALSWLNKPFAGFLTYQDAFVSVSGTRDWSGPKAGIKFGERIIAVDGQPVHGGRDLVAMVKKKQVGAPVRYLVESGGKTREVIVPVSKFSVTDFVLVCVVPLLAGLMLYSLGCTVYLLKPNTSTSWVFLLACFCMGAMVLAGLENQTSYILTSLFWIINAVWPFTLLHLFLIFPERHRILTRFPKFEYLLYVPVLILITVWEVYLLIYPQVLSGESASWFPTYRELGRINSVFRFFCVASLVFLILSSILKPFTSQARQRAKVIFWGVVLGFGPPVIVMTLFFFVKVDVPWNLLVFFTILFPASIAYSIVRHNLFDADAIIKRTVGYAVVTAIIVGAYILVSIGLNVLLGQYQIAQSRAFPIVFTLIIILIFNPLRDRIQSLVDRIFFRKEYDYGEIVNKIGGAVTSLMDLGQILRQMVNTFTKDMFIDTSSVMLLSPTGMGYQVYLADGESKIEIEQATLQRDQPLIQMIEKHKKELTKYDIIEDPKYKTVCRDCIKDFETLHASLMVPLVFQDKVIGLINLGEKKSGKSFNREDINLLHSVANQGAVAIENARLFQENLEKQRMEEELNIARDLQMSMLPSISPQIKGFTIAATSIPAREVGGDFYDFIEMEEGNIGFVVGDVTGKSVSGALVMSSSRSVFRMLSEAELNVGEIMSRANRRMKKDLKSGMFVALLYAVLDSKTRVLSLCSAGQTQPIHFSAETGKARLVQTEGDTFPIGILDEAEYKETRLPLAPGDTLVFYTDGIVEATNEQGEMFGFERLLGLVREARSTGADRLLKEILEKVGAFVGAATQHDDLTVIAVSVSE
jgi:sigma-B regulation protein RsbU (phosphoserine phosphatase)